MIIRDGAGLVREDCLQLKGESAGHWIQFSSQFHQCNCVTGRTRIAPHILLLQASPPAAAPGDGVPTIAPSSDSCLILVLLHQTLLHLGVLLRWCSVCVVHIVYALSCCISTIGARGPIVQYYQIALPSCVLAAATESHTLCRNPY